MESRNDATMVFMCKWVKNHDAKRGFKDWTSQERS